MSLASSRREYRDRLSRGAQMLAEKAWEFDGAENDRQRVGVLSEVFEITDAMNTEALNMIEGLPLDRAEAVIFGAREAGG